MPGVVMQSDEMKPIILVVILLSVIKVSVIAPNAIGTADRNMPKLALLELTILQQTFGANITKLFTAQIPSVPKKVRPYVAVSHFDPSLIFVGTYVGVHSDRLQSCLEILDKVGSN
jgi:hypothetical protein